jgi:hypothetical protein
LTVFRIATVKTLSRLHEFKEPQLLRRKGQVSPTRYGLGAVEHQGFLRRQGNQRALGRRKARGVKHAVADIFDFVLAPIIATVILRQHHVVQNRPQLLAIDPQKDLGLGYAFAESGKRDYSRPLLSEPCVKLWLHTAQAWSNAPGGIVDAAFAGRGFDTVSPLA